MTVDTYSVMRSMIGIYATLHPQHRTARNVSWEMDVDTAEALAREANELNPGAVLELDLSRGGVELQVLGIRVAVVGRPGVRLVIEAVSG